MASKKSTTDRLLGEEASLLRLIKVAEGNGNFVLANEYRSQLDRVTSLIFEATSGKKVRK